MSGPVPPVRPAPRMRPVRRRLHLLTLRNRVEEHAAEPAPARAEPAPPPVSAPSDPGVAAQLLGERERRGLRGGYEIREQARAIYLQTEFAGPHDRRPRKGRITKTEV